jgi:hypothetical protein
MPVQNQMQAERHESPKELPDAGSDGQAVIYSLDVN